MLLSGPDMIKSNVGQGHQSMLALVDGQGHHARLRPWPSQTACWQARDLVWLW